MSTATASSLGERVRRLRRQRDWTQQQLAAATGFTRSLICKIEKEAVVPPVATLMKLAAAFGVTASSLMAESEDQTVVFVPAQRVRDGMTRTENGYAIFPFPTLPAGERVQMFLFEGRQGEVKRHAVTHEGEEFVYVLEGRLEFTVGARVFAMGPGDGLWFPSRESHGFQPLDPVVRYLNLFV